VTAPTRLHPRRWSERAWGWIGPIGVAVLAFVLRVWNVGYPRKLEFDETYYGKDAWSLLKHGYVQDWADGANSKIAAGHYTANLMTGLPTEIVHPDGGKWIISIGEAIFGFNSFGWRISAVVVGALTVLVLARLVRRLTGSTAIGCFAGLLLCFDGMHFVMSRLALLDVFLAFWVVCGVACLVADRDWLLHPGRGDRLVRHRPFRPWQLAAGVCFGMACGTKWNGVYVLAAFGLLAVVWEVLARRRARKDIGLAPHGFRTTFAVGVPAFLSIVVVAFAVYLATWTGFLIHHHAYELRYGHGYGADNPPWGSYISTPAHGFLGETRNAFRSLWHFHVMVYDFHTGDYLAKQHHPYQSNPLGWLVMERPVGVDAQNDLPAASCGAPATSSCMREVLILGNPILWWTGALALLAALVAWIVSRDWRWGVPVVAVAVSWLPWFRFDDRPIFSFYAVAFIPFTIIAIALVVNGMVRSVDTPRQLYVVSLVSGAFLVAVVVTFWYFYPIYTDQLIPYDTWFDKMWFNRWI
jgi:dolichyl-phosphate-mannose--protein O-mannosyl transferase